VLKTALLTTKLIYGLIITKCQIIEHAGP